MTLTGSIMGTAQYLSPEQAQGYAVSEASDIYAVGVVLYELLTGGVPFEGDSAVTIALKQVSVQPSPPSQLGPQVSPALDAVVLRAMAKDPAARFAGADELIAALQQARAGIAPAPLPVGNDVPPTAALLLPPPVPGEGGTGDAAVAETETDRRRAGWIAAGIAAAVILAVILLLLLLPGKSGEVIVPDVTGQTQSAATATLKREGLTPVVSVTPNAHVVSGLVIGTTPPRGTSVHKGAHVSVFVSSGAESVAVPNVVHKPSAEALKILTQKGLQPTAQNESSETVAKGLVVSTDPTAGVGLQIGSPVTVLVSSGARETSVPEVSGESQANATATLSAAGLKVSTVKREVAEPTAGTVISQSPAAGAQAKPGSTVTIVVAQAPAKTAVPSVVGQSEVQAIGTLKAAGFETTTVTRTVTEESKVGTVLQQSPGAGAKLAKGQVVTLAIGKLGQKTTSTETTPTPQPPGGAPSAGAPPASG
jgi:serine/threonine-protein kinase